MSGNTGINTGINTGPSSPRRHWNGDLGARHEHQNVWMNGGARSPATTAPWAGWDAQQKERRVRFFPFPPFLHAYRFG